MPADHPRWLRVTLGVWIALTAVLAVQQFLLYSLAGGPFPLWKTVLFKLSLVPLWALATPLILRSASRYALHGPAARRNFLCHTVIAAGFIVGGNLLIRIPQFVNPAGIDFAALWPNLALGLIDYGPMAFLLYALILGIGTWLNDQREGVTAGPEACVSAESQALTAAQPSMPETGSGGGTTLSVREGDTLRLVPMAEIDYIEANDNYIRVAAKGQVYRIRKPLGEVEALLDARRFIRIHRSAIVPIHLIRAVVPMSQGDWAIEMASGKRIRVARSRRRALQAALAERASQALAQGASAGRYSATR